MTGFSERFRSRSLIERYVRCSVEIPGGSVEVGLQYEPGENTVAFRNLLRSVVSWAVGDRPGELTELEASHLTAVLDLEMTLTWPKRAWFVEVWNATEALSQVFAPFGLPRTGVR